MTKKYKPGNTLLKALSILAKIDWRSAALVLAALGGVFGAVCNRVDQYADKLLTTQTQKGAYEVLAARVDEILIRLDVIEGKPAPEPPPERAQLMLDSRDKLVEVLDTPKNLSRLPAFDAIQKAIAQDNKMPIIPLEASAAPASSPNL